MSERGAWGEKFQVFDDVPPTHVSHNIMKQRLGEDAIEKMKKWKKLTKMKKHKEK